MPFRHRSGFMLVELLVLFSTMVPVVLGTGARMERARINARDAKRISDMRQMRTALELFYVDQGGGYPAGAFPSLGDAQTACLHPGGFVPRGCKNPYMMVPSNPTPGGQPYAYTAYTDAARTKVCTRAPCAFYQIAFALEHEMSMLADTSGEQPENTVPNCVVTDTEIRCQ
ncbi:type II secretion system protein [Candidatus Uhrbacteria bacterium]|nr:type II secretion system protein [Candidatus Uhrbacteria bacterium]